jgi:hypothetical protein
MVTKEEFENAYRKFPPSKAELFFMTYISVHSLRNNLHIVISALIFLLLPLIAQISFHYCDISHIIELLPTFTYALILAFLGIYWNIIWFKKYKRYKKIRKYLNLSKKEYRDIITMFYFKKRYPNIEEFLKRHSK